MCMYVVCPTTTSPATAAQSKTPAILPKHEAPSDLKKRKAGLCIYVHVTYCIMEIYMKEFKAFAIFIFC